MSLIEALILGLVRGITGVLPVSSSGHVVLIGEITGAEYQIDPYFTMFLHFGFAIALAIVFRREIVKVALSICGIVIDAVANIGISFSRSDKNYRRIISGTYRKLTVMLLISLIPSTLLICALAEVQISFFWNMLVTGFGMLLSSMVLFVASFAERRTKGPKEAEYKSAVIIGTLGGAAALPGISAVGMTLSASAISGFTLKFAKIYVFLLVFASVITMAVAEIRVIGHTTAFFPEADRILGMAATAGSAYVMLKLFYRRIGRNARGFAIYGACVGLLSIILYLING